jgi:uroporphyrinogen-III decarboxylase
MNRSFYLDLARRGLRMPIGTDLVLHEQTDPERVARDGEALGRVVEAAARKFDTPLAFAHMDLMREKAALLSLLEIPPDRIPTYHFDGPPDAGTVETIRARIDGPLHPALQAHADSIGYVAAHTDLVPIGMSIGPFSLMTKLLADPITPIYMAGTGATAEEDEDVAAVEALLELSLLMVRRTLGAQLAAGAKAIFIAEPAANAVYLSPKQLAAGADIFERYVTAYSRQIKALLASHGAELVFHCCGELVDSMVQAFGSLEPVILSLGSSRKLWEDARLVPEGVVLYGNLPTKHFYSDTMVSKDDVARMTCRLLAQMQATGHPFILGSECDVLHVPEHAAAIREKIDIMVGCRCD